MTFFCMALALAVYYSTHEVRFAGTFNPQGSLEAYEAKLAETPSMTCECKNQGVPMGEYTTTNLNILPSPRCILLDLQNAHFEQFICSA